MEKEDKIMMDDVTTLVGDSQPPAAPVVPPVEPPAELPKPPELPPEPPKEEPPIEEPPMPPVEAPAAPIAPVQPPAPPAPPAPPVDPKDKELEELRKTVEHLRGMVETAARTAIAPPAQSTPAPAVGPDGKLIEPKPTVHSFVVDDKELDKALETPENFNTLMTNVVNKAQESVLTMIPQLVAKMADQVVTQKMAVAEFYRENQDLSQNKAFVGMVANELAAAHPDWNMEKIITELGPVVRDKLKLAGVVVQPPVAPSAAPSEPPAFVPGGGARPNSAAPQMTAMEKDILDLIKDA